MPQIEFTLPSPTIGIENLPAVDPPWMPKFETKVENLDIRRRGQTILSATQSHRQQPTVLVRSILFDEKDKKRKERENLPITSLPVELPAAQEPSLSSAAQERNQNEDSDTEHGRSRRANATVPSVARALLPATICSSSAGLVALQDDQAVSDGEMAVCRVAKRVNGSFLVEDCNLSLEYFLVKLTRESQHGTFQLLKSLIRHNHQMPHQAALSLYNYLIGYIMFNARNPRDMGEEMIDCHVSAVDGGVTIQKADKLTYSYM